MRLIHSIPLLFDTHAMHFEVPFDDISLYDHIYLTQMSQTIDIKRIHREYLISALSMDIREQHHLKAIVGKGHKALGVTVYSRFDGTLQTVAETALGNHRSTVSQNRLQTQNTRHKI